MDDGSNNEQAVIVNFNYGIQGLGPLHKLEKKLEQIIKENKVGEYDGHEIAMDYIDGVLYMYGPDAEILFKAIKPTIDSSEFMKGAKALLYFGPSGDNSREIDVELE